MLWESWVVVAIFVMNFIYMLVMAFVSPYFKVLFAKGVGKAFNITWLCTIIVAAGVLMFYNIRCSLDNNSGQNCKYLAISIVVFLLLLTILNMSWGIYNTIEYNKKAAAKPSQSTKQVSQEHKKGT